MIAHRFCGYWSAAGLSLHMTWSWLVCYVAFNSDLNANYYSALRQLDLFFAFSSLSLSNLCEGVHSDMGTIHCLVISWSTKIASFSWNFFGNQLSDGQAKIRRLLMWEGIWKVVNGQVKKPALDVNKIFLWEKADDKALAIIGLRLKLADNLIHHVDFNNKSAHEMWTKLENLFGNMVITQTSFSNRGYSILR